METIYENIIRKADITCLEILFGRLFPLIFILVGSIVTFFGGRGLVRAYGSVDWPTAQGKVVISSIDVQQSKTSGSTKSTTSYHAEIQYEFTVDGISIDGDRVAYGDYGTGNSNHASSIVKRYPVGKEVTVHYMPGNPEQAQLEPGMRAQALILPGVGLVLFIAGCLVAVLFHKAFYKPGTGG